jgi:predicted  nucleic acid-binding Zn-ribbon protein
VIDTLKMKETFEVNGFSNTQASCLSHAMNDVSKEQKDLATKDELHQVRNELKNDIKEVREEIKDVRGEIKDLRTQINNLWDSFRDLRKDIALDMENLENRIVHKLTYRSMLSQISIGMILISLMIYFHQNP